MLKFTAADRSTKDRGTHESSDEAADASPPASGIFAVLLAWVVALCALLYPHAGMGQGPPEGEPLPGERVPGIDRPVYAMHHRGPDGLGPSSAVAWETGEPNADANLDGGVDGGDVEFFFVAWEAGGC